MSKILISFYNFNLKFLKIDAIKNFENQNCIQHKKDYE